MFTLQNEGGYNNFLDSEGGETKYGITKKSFPHLNIKSLTIQQAREIYKSRYWDNNLCKHFLHKDIAVKVFDLSVHVGHKRAYKIVRGALGRLGINLATGEPRELIQRVNGANPAVLLTCIKNESATYYKDLCHRNKRMRKFLIGWTRRAHML